MKKRKRKEEKQISFSTKSIDFFPLNKREREKIMEVPSIQKTTKMKMSFFIPSLECKNKRKTNGLT